MNPSRINRLIAWLTKFNEELNEMEAVFTSNLIGKDEIGEQRHDRIIDELMDVQCTIDDILAEFENKGSEE